MRKRFIAEHEGRLYIIDPDKPEVGWYVYRIEGNQTTHDYLQDTLEMAKECALEEFGVPIDLWREVRNEGELPKWFR